MKTSFLPAHSVFYLYTLFIISFEWAVEQVCKHLNLGKINSPGANRQTIHSSDILSFR